MNDQNAFLRLLAAQAQAAQQPLSRTNGRSGQRNGMNNMSNMYNSPEMAMWQTFMAAQAQAQMLALQQQQLQLQQQQQQSTQPSSFEEVLKKLSEQANRSKVSKNEPEKKASTEANNIDRPSTSGATVTVKEGAEIKLEAGEIPKPIKSNPQPTTPQLNKNMLDAAMWQLLAAQMMQQQNALKSNGHNNRASQKKDAFAAAMDLSKIKSETNGSDGAETRSTATPSEPHEHRKRQQATEPQVRVPVKLGWRRQTCIRAIAASGVRGDVIYYAPCGKKLSTYAEVLRYLMKNPCGPITRDNFSFSSKLVVGEFILPKEGPNGEKLIIKLSEEEVNDEINRLLSQKPAPKNGERRTKEPRAPSPDEIQDLDDAGEALKGTYDDEEKIKWSREPIDDLLLTEIRPMPELPRIPHLELRGEGFADALMVFEFINNFGEVLRIDSSTILPLDEFCAGLVGDDRYVDGVLQLTRTLFGLALEYPGLPSGKKGRNKLGQSLLEVGLKRENYSELMHLFLHSRDEQGKKLSLLLENSSFESLCGEAKASILAFLCNEILCCRNIVKEIDGNLEEIGKLKGDRWLRDGKARALRTHQKRKRKDERAHHHHHHDDDGEERPGSRNSDSEGSRAGSPIPHSNRKLTPGLGQVEILTPEEENMTADELDVVISKLKEESEDLKNQINGLSQRVRSFPFGWDRFHRQYWQLPHVATVLVESIESSGPHNPACNAQEVCGKDPEPVFAPNFVHPDVMACVEDLVDDVTMNRLTVDKRRKRKVRRLDNPYKRGWWMVETRECLEAVRGSLHGRGIRERCLHRLLCKNWFMKDVRCVHFEMLPAKNVLAPEVCTSDAASRLLAAISSLEHRISGAHMNIEGWNPTPKINSTDDDNDWKYIDNNATCSLALEDLKKRILECESIIERKYLRQSFYAGEAPSVARILGLSTKESEEKEKEDYENPDDYEDEKNADKEKDEEDRELIDVWKSYVRDARTTAELMLALQCLESSIAWERSVTDACCQICKTVGEADKLLLCDGCQMGYHLYCLRPALTSVPEGDWFCARCVESASGRPTCVMCLKEGAPIYPCRKCYNFYHIECSKQHTPERPSEYVCKGCDTKNFERRVILRGESEERAELEESAEPESKEVRRASKRKAEAPAPVVFPSDMGMDLCRTMLDELEVQPSVGPFLEPVDLDAVPGYADVIEHPIDLSTIRTKVDTHCYDAPDDFATDIELMFSNCRLFNEDDSPVGYAGQTLHKFFSKRWRQVKYNYSKRLRRMRS